jgi:hypothetical protein
MKTQQIIYIFIGLIIILGANIAGHYFPPFSLTYSFIYMNFIIGLVNLPLYKINFNYTVIYNYILLLINDLFIRLYAGGNHDSEGMAWCWLMFYVSFIIATLIIVIYCWSTNLKNMFPKNKPSLNLTIIGAILTAVFYNFVNAKI